MFHFGRSNSTTSHETSSAVRAACVCVCVWLSNLPLRALFRITEGFWSNVLSHTLWNSNSYVNWALTLRLLCHRNMLVSSWYFKTRDLWIKIYSVISFKCEILTEWQIVFVYGIVPGWWKIPTFDKGTWIYNKHNMVHALNRQNTDTSQDTYFIIWRDSSTKPQSRKSFVAEMISKLISHILALLLFNHG